MSSSSRALAVLGGVAAIGTVLAALAYLLLKRPVLEQPKAAVNTKGADDDDDVQEVVEDAAGGAVANRDETKPKVPKPALCEIFREVTKEMSKIIQNIGKLEQQLLEEAAQSGRNVDPEMLKEHLINKFVMDVREAEAVVYSRYGVTQAEVEISAQYFRDDADFEKEVKNLRRKFSLFTGQGIEDVPDHITMELIMDVLSETMTKMTQAMTEVYAKTRESYDVGTEAFAQTLQAAYVEKVGTIRTKVQKKFNIDQDTLQAGVLKYQTNPVFQQRMIDLTNHQKDEFAKLGLGV